MSKVEDILKKFSDHEIFWSDGHGGDSTSNMDTKTTVDAINKLIIEARIDELSHIEPIPEAEPYLRFWWGEKNKERDIAMTLSERISELQQSLKGKE